jgi:OHCU decarboxylase
MRLSELNALDGEAAARLLLACCGSVRWARALTAARPFATRDRVFDAADECWRALGPADYLEAFAAHPRIGQTGGTRQAGQVGPLGQVEEVAKERQAETWSADEQAGTRDAAQDVLRRLAAANRAYETRFGYIFIICATGKSADEMLAALDERLHNPPDQELTIAAEQQRCITRLRLAKLIDG